uniref:Sb:cb470 n=1 Tax=Sinocyclocheilus anshuiensis TaxID=1608454 RepID=A0A671KPP4_9TELE
MTFGELKQSLKKQTKEYLIQISSRTKEYLLFRDPENKFHPSPSTLSEIFLMTYIQRSKQKILLGAHWVWTVLDQPSKNPWSGFFICRKELRGTVFRYLQRHHAHEDGGVLLLHRQTVMCFSSFFGRQNDEGNIYGLLTACVDAVRRLLSQ